MRKCLLVNALGVKQARTARHVCSGAARVCVCARLPVGAQPQDGEERAVGDCAEEQPQAEAGHLARTRPVSTWQAQTALLQR